MPVCFFGRLAGLSQGLGYFPVGDARQLYRTIRRVLSLPDETRLFRCHDYKAPGRDEFAWGTTVGEQLRTSVHVNEDVSEDEFVACARRGTPRWRRPSCCCLQSRSTSAPEISRRPRPTGSASCVSQSRSGPKARPHEAMGTLPMLKAQRLHRVRVILAADPRRPTISLKFQQEVDLRKNDPQAVPLPPLFRSAAAIPPECQKAQKSSPWNRIVPRSGS